VPRVKIVTILHLVEVLGGRETAIEVPEGTTVAGLMRILAGRVDAATADQVFVDSAGTLQPSITVMVNGRLLVFTGGPDTVLSDGDEVLLLPPVGGG